MDPKAIAASIAKRKAKAAEPARVIARFMRHVEQQPNGCWLWVGARQGAGNYGFFWLNGAQVYAHRASYTIFKGLIPAGLLVRHRCDDRACVAPDHLELGTHRDNMRDAVERGRIAGGSRNGNAKLTETQVAAIRAEYSGHVGDRARLATKYGLQLSTVSQILAGRTWRSVAPAVGVSPMTKAPFYVHGASHPNSKVTEAIVREIRTLRAQNVPNVEIARRVGIKPAQCSAIATGKAWRHVI